jgi:hypothetical protein
MENATYQEGCAPAYVPGMSMPGGVQVGYAPEANNGGCAGPAEAPGATGQVGPVGTPAGQAMAAEACAETEKADEGQNRYMGQKPAQAPEQPPVQAQGPAQAQAQEGPKGYVSQGPSGYAKGYSQAPSQPEPPRAEAGLGQQYAYQGPQAAPQYGAPSTPRSTALPRDRNTPIRGRSSHPSSAPPRDRSSPRSTARRPDRRRPPARPTAMRRARAKKAIAIAGAATATTRNRRPPRPSPAFSGSRDSGPARPARTPSTWNTGTAR